MSYHAKEHTVFLNDAISLDKFVEQQHRITHLEFNINGQYMSD